MTRKPSTLHQRCVYCGEPIPYDEWNESNETPAHRVCANQPRGEVWGERVNKHRPTVTAEECQLIARAFREPKWFQRIPREHIPYYLDLVTHAARYGHKPSVRTQAARALYIISERQRLCASDPLNGGSLPIASARHVHRNAKRRSAEHDGGGTSGPSRP